ncbi:enoyl-(Acyl carrier protein) reductase [Hirsutella rhossiliensis]|uniref:Enoyl-(Acyl carrier protein) reductase domain-containing protein n=1 Tax=Hirsutella rhossiliensis TaxID=111463 RepID=A0A9P8SKV9_9HYPO|nr:enoyl-(Acyl carrier protein) reductase domain-containing protein [Hirsutella rhossiliensis]KAH0966301.1 enoyl-(Acyl carrier protein) reductase domain-containing protein [Hirsutella rhossiliensis]
MPEAGFAYGPSNAAVMHLTKQLSTVLSPLKIRANSITPGIYPSDMTESTFFKDSANQEGGLSKEAVPLDRCGAEEELAGAALFLASKAGGYVDGNILLTDGGRLGIMPGSS